MSTALSRGTVDGFGAVGGFAAMVQSPIRCGDVLGTPGLRSGGRRPRRRGASASAPWPPAAAAGADGASATALQPPRHLLTTLPAPAGDGRCGCHGTAATAAGGGGAMPLEGDLGERLGRSPRTSVPAPRPWRANVLLVRGEAQRGWRRRLWGGWSSQASTRPRALWTGSGLARAATTWSPRRRRRARDRPNGVPPTLVHHQASSGPRRRRPGGVGVVLRHDRGPVWPSWSPGRRSAFRCGSTCVGRWRRSERCRPSLRDVRPSPRGRRAVAARITPIVLPCALPSALPAACAE